MGWHRFLNSVGVRLHAFAVLGSQALTVSIAYADGPDPRRLIGLEITGTSYPDSWKQIGSDGFGRSPIILTTLQNKSKRSYALVLEKQLNIPRSGQKTKTIQSIVTDAIAVKNPTSYHQFARRCYFENPLDAEKNTIYAEVGFNHYCDMKTSLIRRAWQINLATGKFDPITNTHGLTCEFGLISIGEPDFREGCPTYNWR